MKIMSNQVECLRCGDKPYSAHRHDFRYCRCGAVAVDGGMDYLRRVCEGDAEVKDLSISIEGELFDALRDGQDWCEGTGRNNLGRICRFFIDLRDNGYKIVKVDGNE